MTACTSSLHGLSKWFHFVPLHKLIEQSVQLYFRQVRPSDMASSPCQVLSFLFKVSFLNRSSNSVKVSCHLFLFSTVTGYLQKHYCHFHIAENSHCKKKKNSHHDLLQILPKWFSHWVCHFFTHWFTHWFCMTSSTFISIAAYNGFTCFTNSFLFQNLFY